MYEVASSDVCCVFIILATCVLLITLCIGGAEDGIIPGRLVPEICHAEAHTDYGGTAVRWGPHHHVESAADCCEACLKQARTAKSGEKRCNVWVFCPAEGGCFSPDIYEHKHQECWLKQVPYPPIPRDCARLLFHGNNLLQNLIGLIFSCKSVHSCYLVKQETSIQSCL